MNDDRLKILKEETTKLNEEVRKQVSGYILAGLGVVAGLAWNEAIKALIDHIYPLSGSGLWIKFVYAIVLTVFIVIVSMYIVRNTRKDEKKK